MEKLQLYIVTLIGHFCVFLVSKPSNFDKIPISNVFLSNCFGIISLLGCFATDPDVIYLHTFNHKTNKQLVMLIVFFSVIFNVIYLACTFEIFLIALYYAYFKYESSYPKEVLVITWLLSFLTALLCSLYTVIQKTRLILSLKGNL